MTRRTRPPLFDRRATNLPLPAVRLGQRLTQLSRAQEATIVQVMIIGGDWIIQVDGKTERLGKDGDDE